MQPYSEYGTPWIWQHRVGDDPPISASCSLSPAASNSSWEIFAAINFEASFGSVAFFCFPLFAVLEGCVEPPSWWWWWWWWPFVYTGSLWEWFVGVNDPLEVAGIAVLVGLTAVDIMHFWSCPPHADVISSTLAKAQLLTSRFLFVKGIYDSCVRL